MKVGLFVTCLVDLMLDGFDSGVTCFAGEPSSKLCGRFLQGVQS